jgi:hypothetical protein
MPGRSRTAEAPKNAPKKRMMPMIQWLTKKTTSGGATTAVCPISNVARDMPVPA